MSSKRTQTRVRILATARRLLVERDFHGVGLEEIARAAGVSRQAIYLHFGSKADLLLALVAYVDEVADFADASRPFQDAKTSAQALDAAVVAVAAIDGRIHDIAAVLSAARRTDPAAEAAWQDRMTKRRSQARWLVEWLRREGLLADDWTIEDAADFVWTFLSVNTYVDLVIERGWSVERYVDRLRAVLRRSLLRDGVRWE